MQSTFTDSKRCLGKPLPKTYDAVCIRGHYMDPRDFSEKVKGLVSALAIAAAVTMSILLTI